MNTFRFRPECSLDAVCFLKLLRPGELVRYECMQQDFADGDTEATCEITTPLSLEEIRNLMRKVPDGHVMVQTVQHRDLYTGQRDFEIPR